jgi:acetyl-CoA carboxylase carboxyl transferase subunit beta
LTDFGSFEPWDEEVVAKDLPGFTDSQAYGERLGDLETRLGCSEAVLTGGALLGGRPLALVLSEFAFLGGSVGVATGERVVRAFDRARRKRWPLLAVTASGGARMQEGVLGFAQMVTTTAAAARYLREGLPFIVYLMDPTLGALLASYGSLGHVTFAMPGALIGFAGPRAVRALTGKDLPRTVQYSENLMQVGLVDDLVGPRELRERVGTILDALAPAAHRSQELAVDEPAPATRDAWACVAASRRPGRPGARRLLHSVARHVTELRGDALGADDAGVIAAIARVNEVPIIFLGYDRPPAGARAEVTPAGLKKARRAMALAEGLRVPLVTVIDTPGAELSRRSEENGLARHIALCLAQMLQLSVPTLSVLMGEGSGGAALALLPADRVLAAENAWLAPIAPEAAAAILYGASERAPELASAQRITSGDLTRFGMVDYVISEDGGSEAFIARLGRILGKELYELVSDDSRQRSRSRGARFRFSSPGPDCLAQAVVPLGDPKSEEDLGGK